MKRILLLVSGMLLAVIIAGCSVVAEDPVSYTPPGEILEQIDNKDTFAFVIGDEDCPACQSYLKTSLKDMQNKSEITLEYIELKGIEEKEKELEDLQAIIEDHLDGKFEATPTTYFIVDGEFEDDIVGVVPYDELLETYETHVTE